MGNVYACMENNNVCEALKPDEREQEATERNEHVTYYASENWGSDSGGE